MATLSKYYEDLLKECVVAIEGYNENREQTFGTGFFVAPGKILTCGHVVSGCIELPSKIDVSWKGQAKSAAALVFARSEPEEYPDLALITVEVTNHPCVYLDEAAEIKDDVWSYGYPFDSRDGDASLLVYEGMTKERTPYMRFRSGQIKPGFSGAPALNLRTKRVCGILEIGLGEVGPLGGRAVAVNAAFDSFHGLREAHDVYHRTEPIWGRRLDRRDPASDIANRLLPYLVDRKEQNVLLRQIINRHQQEHAGVPLICFFHGNAEECLVEYQKCLEEEYLADLLKLPKGSTVYFKFIDWPIVRKSARRLSDMQDPIQQQFISDLAVSIYDEIRSSGTEREAVEPAESLPERISGEIRAYPEPLAFGFHPDGVDLFVYPRKVQWFLRFWSAISVNPHRLCMIFVFVEHRRSPASGPFRFFQKLTPIRSREVLAKQPESLLPAHVLPEFGSVQPPHVVEWINRYSSRIEHYWFPPFTLRAELEDHFARKGSDLSMLEFAKATADLLGIPHTPIS